MDIKISSDLEEVMNERGVSREDVEGVLVNAEKNQTFLVADDGSFLAKHRLENFCPYVAYEKDGDSYIIKSVYAHRVLLGHEILD